MKVKETIAFIGEANQICSDLIQKLAANNYPLVLVTKEGNHFEDLFRQILNHIPDADVETISCAHEGCWEADIIVFDNLNFDPGFSEKIKEVTNQKILVYFLNKENQSSILMEEIKSFRQLLPNTEWVEVIFDPVSEEMHITGADEATGIIENIFNQAGYTTNLLKAIA